MTSGEKCAIRTTRSLNAEAERTEGPVKAAEPLDVRMTSRMLMKHIHEFLEEFPKPFLSFFAFLLVLVIGGLDTFVSHDISIIILYMFPIMLVAWYEGGIPAALLSFFSAVTWAVSDLTSGHMYPHMSVIIWNGITALGIFLIIAFSMTAIKKLSIKARKSNQIDDLTGVSNVRFFYDQARIEISKSAMHKRSFTLAYIDLDNLRHINDTLGHMVGDYLLHETARIMKSALRPIDIISRFGGAKFVILMPETKNQDTDVAIRTVQMQLSRMLKRNGWGVTFHIGVITCNDPTCTIDRLIKMAEDFAKTAGVDSGNTTKYKIVDIPPIVS